MIQATAIRTDNKLTTAIANRYYELLEDRLVVRSHLEMQLTHTELVAYKNLERLLTISIIELEKHL